MDFFSTTMKKYCLSFVLECAFNNISYLLLVVCAFYPVANTVVIKRLSVPRWIQNGTEEAVVLDCEYIYNENDLHLVVKWYFGDNPMPVYQWIPALDSRNVGVGTFQNRLDLNFAVNTANAYAYSKYRALRILKPTIEMSGKYTCQVTSLASMDTQEQNMTVYVPAKNFNLVLRETSNGSLNVSCEANGLFPVPELKLSTSSQSSRNNPFTVNLESETFMSRGPYGTYDINVYRTFTSWELSKNREVEFECMLEIPGTNYTRAKRITYFPGVQDSRIGALSNVARTTLQCQLKLLSLTIIIISMFMLMF